jgi:hypothetical protein
MSAPSGSGTGPCPQAAVYQRQALALFGAGNNPIAEAGTLTNIGVLLYRQGRWDEAASHQRSAIAIFRELGNRVGEAAALDSLGLDRVRCHEAGVPDRGRLTVILQGGHGDAPGRRRRRGIESAVTR